MAIPAPRKENKAMVASVTTADGQLATVTTVALTPDSDSYIEVIVGGIMVEVGDAVKTKDCYFSGDSGSTARAIADIVAGDELYWNGSIAGYELNASFEIDFNYIA